MAAALHPGRLARGIADHAGTEVDRAAVEIAHGGASTKKTAGLRQVKSCSASVSSPVGEGHLHTGLLEVRAAMNLTIVPAAPGQIVVAVEYDATGVAWAKLTSYQALAWCVDNSLMPMPPMPQILDTLPPLPPDTSPIVSPQWAKYLDGNAAIQVQNQWTGPLYEFFTWLATNNGATRQLAGQFSHSASLMNGFSDWARGHPDLVYPD
jgi:hypothetical protein